MMTEDREKKHEAYSGIRETLAEPPQFMQQKEVVLWISTAPPFFGIAALNL